MKHEINNLGDRISSLETARINILQLKDDIKSSKLECLKHTNSSLSSEIRINSVPFTKDENLDEIFGYICNTLNIAKPS